MASGVDEELVVVTAFNHEEATSACDEWCGLGRDGGTKHISKRVAEVYKWVGGA